MPPSKDNLTTPKSGNRFDGLSENSPGNNGDDQGTVQVESSDQGPDNTGEGFTTSSPSMNDRVSILEVTVAENSALLKKLLTKMDLKISTESPDRQSKVSFTSSKEDENSEVPGVTLDIAQKADDIEKVEDVSLQKISLRRGGRRTAELPIPVEDQNLQDNYLDQSISHHFSDPSPTAEAKHTIRMSYGPRSYRRRESMDDLLEEHSQGLHYLDKSPENGHESFSVGNKFKPNLLDFSDCCMKTDDPIQFKVFYDTLSTKTSFASATGTRLLIDFKKIRRGYNFMKDFKENPKYKNSYSVQIFVMTGAKIAQRVKEASFTNESTAPETYQIIAKNMLETNGWEILQDLLEQFHPIFGNVHNFDPEKEMINLSIVAGETQSQFLLRAIKIRTRLELCEGETPTFRLVAKVVSELYTVPELKPILSELYASISMHSKNFGYGDNSFPSNIEEVSHLLRAFHIPFSFILKKPTGTANIAALQGSPYEELQDEVQFEQDSFQHYDTDANVCALASKNGGYRTSRYICCEICYSKEHTTIWCPCRGDTSNNEFISDEVKRRAKQFNVKIGEYKPRQPPRPPRPPLRRPPTAQVEQGKEINPETSKNSQKKKPLTKEARASISAFTTKYFDSESQQVLMTNRDTAQICSLGMDLLENYDPQSHPLSTLEALEKVAESNIEPITSAIVGSVMKPPEGLNSAYITSPEVLVLDTTNSNVTSSEIQSANDASSHAAMISALSNSKDNQFKYEMFTSNVRYFPGEIGEDEESFTDDVNNYSHNNDDDLNDNQDIATDKELAPAQISAITQQMTRISIDQNIRDHHICSNISNYFDTGTPSAQDLVDQTLQNRILMAQRRYGAPSNMVSLIRNGTLSRAQAVQFLTRLEEQNAFIVSTPARLSNGSGSITSPIDLTNTASPVTIDLTGESPLTATIAASTSDVLSEEPQSLITNNTRATATVPASHVRPNDDQRAPFLNEDNSFDPTGMREFSS